ncbi:MAG TPA: DUF4097 family beta strand repeat-containing protein [Gemmatimonadales bacterium]|nr:DUF4097 family beta strand repeat-containing protein [Gemmatimonadales bacterium]
MLFALAPVALAALTLIQQIDSTVPVERGQRLEVDLFAGDVDVKTWTKNAVRVVADPDGRGRVEIERSATSLSVRTTGRRGPPSSTDIQLTVPAWMALDISGVYSDITIAGARGPISAETVQGDVSAEGGDGLVSVKSVQGGVSVTGAKGRIEANSVNADVEVHRSAGEISTETVNGSIELSGTDATTLTATSVNGDLSYDGPVHPGGRYTLSTHNGDITLAMAEGASAAVSVSTFNGEFESDFPVTLTETRKGKRFNFTVGSGSAQVTLESFQGTISLVRPGSQHHRDRDDDDDE